MATEYREIEKHKQGAVTEVQEIVRLADGNEEIGWKFVHEKEGIKVWRMKQKGSSLFLMKGSGTIKASLQDLYDCLLDFRQIENYDPLWIKGSRLEPTVKEGSLVFEAINLCFKAPGPVSNRDFVVIGVNKREEDGSFVQVSKSIEHPACPPQHGFVRGELQHSGYVVRKIDDSTCSIVYIVGVDPKGWIPKWMVNMVSTNQPMNIKLIREYLESGKFAAKKKGTEAKGS